MEVLYNVINELQWISVYDLSTGILQIYTLIYMSTNKLVDLYIPISIKSFCFTLNVMFKFKQYVETPNEF